MILQIMRNISVVMTKRAALEESHYREGKISLLLVAESMITALLWLGFPRTR